MCSYNSTKKSKVDVKPTPSTAGATPAKTVKRSILSQLTAATATTLHKFVKPKRVQKVTSTLAVPYVSGFFRLFRIHFTIKFPYEQTRKSNSKRKSSTSFRSGVLPKIVVNDSLVTYDDFEVCIA